MGLLIGRLRLKGGLGLGLNGGREGWMVGTWEFGGCCSLLFLLAPCRTGKSRDIIVGLAAAYRIEYAFVTDGGGTSIHKT